jgi:hypothetical protein
LWHSAACDSTKNVVPFGQSAFGQSAFGQSAFGQSALGQSAFEQSAFEKSAFEQSTFEQSEFGQKSWIRMLPLLQCLHQTTFLSCPETAKLINPSDR